MVTITGRGLHLSYTQDAHGGCEGLGSIVTRPFAAQREPILYLQGKVYQILTRLERNRLTIVAGQATQKNLCIGPLQPLQNSASSRAPHCAPLATFPVSRNSEVELRVRDRLHVDQRQAFLLSLFFNELDSKFRKGCYLVDFTGEYDRGYDNRGHTVSLDQICARCSPRSVFPHLNQQLLSKSSLCNVKRKYLILHASYSLLPCGTLL